MRRAALIVAAQVAALAASPATGQVVSERPDTVAVTIYREGDARTAEFDDVEDFADGGLALITEVRTVDLPAGRSRVSFRGVADGLVPETAAIEGLNGDAVERNYDFDLLSPGTLMERAVGERVRVVKTNRATGEVTEADAIIRSGPNGVVLQTAEGFEALSCTGETERVVFDRAPEDIADRPTLSAVVETKAAGPRQVRLSYLATGFNWSADYVARLAPDGKSLDLTGWITLANGGGVSFVDAPTQVVAGELSRDDETEAPGARVVSVGRQCWPGGTTASRPERGEEAVVAGNRVADMQFAATPVASLDDVEEIVVTGSRIARMSELGDYKLYSLPEPTTVAARQSKQVRFLEARAVPVERVYVYEVHTGYGLLDDPEPEHGPIAMLRLKNEKAAELGVPLPAGGVAVTETDGRGRFVLAGEDKLRDTPVGLPFELELGRAIDVSVTPEMLWDKEIERGGRTRARFEIEVELVNAKPEPVRVEVSHHLDEGEAGGKVLAETRPHKMKNGRPLWSFTLKPGERRTFRYTYEHDA